MNGKIGSFCYDLQLVVCNQGSDFDDRAGFWIETRHFEVYPNQMILRSVTQGFCPSIFIWESPSKTCFRSKDQALIL